MEELARRPTPLRTRRPSIADRIQRCRQQGFVGRVEQRRLFALMLRGEGTAPQILFVHGLGGIGKSALLRRFAADAGALGRPVFWVDGSQVGGSSEAFEDQAAAVRSVEAPVLFVDAFERCQELEQWLRDHFLPAAPDDVLVVVAGRWAPQPHWTLDAGWRGLVRVIALGPIEDAEAAALLDERGVPRHLQPAVRDFAGGHPLALCLAAADAHGTDPSGGEWEPGPDVVRTLLGQVVDPPPSAAHQYGLRVCGHVRHTTVDLLRTAFDDQTAAAVFDWLSSLPYVRRSRYGLHPHELVRDALDADFAWRSPEEYAQVHLHLWRHLGTRARRATGAAAAFAVAELVHLTRYGDRLGRRPLDAEERPALIEQPHSASARADVLRLDDLAADPALAAVREYLERRGGLADTDRVGVARFLAPAVVDGVAPDVGPLVVALLAANMHEFGVVASVLLVPEPELVVARLEMFDFHPVGRGSGVFVHDRRDQPGPSPAHRSESAAEPRPDRRPRPVRAHRFSEEEHYDAVRRALRDWHDDDAVAANPLVGFHGDEAALRTAVSDAIGALGADPSLVRHLRVVRATYLERTASQEATAAWLGMPFGTYRRYLASGVKQVAEHLWMHHTAGRRSAV